MNDGPDAETALRERLGRAVAARRAELRLSQGGLADRAGVSRTYVSSIETASQAPSVVVVAQVAEALGTTTGALLGETASPAPAIPGEIRDLAVEIERQADGLAKAARNMSSLMSAVGAGSAGRVDEAYGPGSDLAHRDSVVHDSLTPYGGDVLPFPVIGPASNVDLPQALRETELPVVAYVAAGEDRHPQPIETGERARVPNPQARRALAQGSSVVKVAGDSMEPNYDEGDYVIVEPARLETIQDGDVCFVMHDGQAMLKVLRFTQRKTDGAMQRVSLVSLNTRYPPIPVYPDDEFHVLGVEAYHVARKKNFR